MPKDPAISVCMIVKDEEKSLPLLLESVKGLADEIIIVDTGSSDRTVGIAERSGAKVYRFEWCDDFSAARNESIRHATGDYILWLDADDVLEKEYHGAIKEHIKNNCGKAAFLKLVNIESDNVSEAIQLRIFPNIKGLQFTGRVHEQISIALKKKNVPVALCDAKIKHYGYQEKELLRKKLERNKRLHELEIEEDPENFYALFFLGRTLKGLGERERSLACLERVIDLGAGYDDPEVMVVALLDMAAILCELGREQEAVSLLSKRLSMFNSSSLITFTLGELYFKLKRYEESYNLLLPVRKASFSNEFVPVDVRTTRLNLFRYLGISSLFTRDYRTAGQCFREALAIDPGNDEIYHYLSLAKEKSGDIEGAIESCRKGLECSGEDSFLRKRIFILNIRRDDLEGALMEHEKLNGHAGDIDVLAGMFLIGCRKLNMAAINDYYRLIQSGLSLLPKDFPDGLDTIRERFALLEEYQALDIFESAISHLLTISG